MGILSAPAAHADATSVGPHYYSDSERLAHDYGANYNYMSYDSAVHETIGINTGALTAGARGPNDPASARADLNDLATVVKLAMGGDPLTPSGYQLDQEMIQALDVNLGRTAAEPAFAGARNFFYNLQPVEVSPNDELRRRLLVRTSTCINVVVITAALTGGTITTMALNNTDLSTIAKSGLVLGISALIAMALNIVNQWNGRNLYIESQNERALVRSSINVLFTVMVDLHHGQVGQYDNTSARLADVENALASVRAQMNSYERAQIAYSESPNGFIGRLWGSLTG